MHNVDLQPPNSPHQHPDQCSHLVMCSDLPSSTLKNSEYSSLCTFNQSSQLYNNGLIKPIASKLKFLLML